jgi:hypothetical protein
VGPVAAADASDATIRATVADAGPKIDRSQAKIIDGLASYQSTHSAAALIKAVKAQDRTLTALQNRLRPQAASTAHGTKGKADIVKGLALIVKSNKTLVKDLTRSPSGEAVSTAQLKAVTKLAKKGNDDLNAGGKLLSV